MTFLFFSTVGRNHNSPERESTLVVRKDADFAPVDFLPYQTQQEPGTQQQAHDVAPADGRSPGHHEEQPSAEPDGELGSAVPGTSTEPSPEDQKEPGTKEGELIKTEQQPKNGGGDDGGGSDGEDSKGLKRKREDVHGEDDARKSTDKKRVQKNFFLDFSIMFSSTSLQKLATPKYFSYRQLMFRISC